MASTRLRPWFTATKCLKHYPTASSSTVRSITTSADGQKRLETVDDWSKLQVDRGNYKMLVNHFEQYGSTQNRDNTFQPHHSLHKPPTPTQTTLSALIAAGAHFGHSKSLMNPNFVPYAYGIRAGITIIDLDHTLPLLRRAANLVRAIAAKDGTIIFVGTRPDLRNVVRRAAERVGEQAYHVGERWLPGTLTNKVQFFGSQDALEQRMTPDLVIFLNPLSNMNAIAECAIEHVPTIGIVDSNVDPRIVMYPIPANDESVRTAELVAGVLSIAGREGAALGVAQRKDQELREARQADRRQRGLERGVKMDLD
jgi:small subunit ribosomal protein S2